MIEGGLSEDGKPSFEDELYRARRYGVPVSLLLLTFPVVTSRGVARKLHAFVSQGLRRLSMRFSHPQAFIADMLRTHLSRMLKFRPRDYTLSARRPLIEQRGQLADQARLGLAAQSQKNKVMARQDRVDHLRHHRILISDDAGKQRFAALDFAD